MIEQVDTTITIPPALLELAERFVSAVEKIADTYADELKRAHTNSGEDLPSTPETPLSQLDDAPGERPQSPGAESPKRYAGAL